MARVGSYIKAAPLIVAKKAGDVLEDGVVYSRFGVSTLSYGTLLSTLDNDFPFVFSSKAGLAASVVGEKLRTRRQRSGISLGEAGRKLGISKRMVQKYEAGESAVSVSRAYSLYRIFGGSVFRKITHIPRQGKRGRLQKVRGRAEVLQPWLLKRTTRAKFPLTSLQERATTSFSLKSERKPTRSFAPCRS